MWLRKKPLVEDGKEPRDIAPIVARTLMVASGWRKSSKMAFRTALNSQSWRCSVVGKDKLLRNGVNLYIHAEFKGDLGNVGYY